MNEFCSRFLVLVSGLELATSEVNFQIQLFVDWVTGILGDENENKKISKIVQVLIAGKYLKKMQLIFIIFFLYQTIRE